MKILFVDNDQAICELFQTTLEKRYQANVITVQTAAQAVAIIKKTSDIDIVVCDYILSDDHGANVYRFIRDNYPQMIFILQTSNLQILKTDTRFFDFFDNIQINRAISRPFTPSELFWVIGDNHIRQSLRPEAKLRQQERCNIIIDAFILGSSINSKQHVRSLNVCQNGMFIICDHDLLQIGDIISYEMSVNFFNYDKPQAIVRWKRKGNICNLPSGVGVEFI
ncbi:MAG: hypothetical protein A2381_06945 [Bdellovibrionales bacterium RIFOXYB1_FULL_37_110]|nr:MAG: hypothetical protein A2417_14820 [Bdellovibrionales bacterium RIFOXYC1_FULL_37_79]OFZ57800.1 MAG: hypothetical protein A2381_06945 [Bdellovibrionales bacterium RIFOXYB1_FULL_37_110]OFZ62766.1 MAG: hypothetical protein A2577_16465 [Bdellovibrionales bacterium RIFOXYD1_FULL_36_51]